MAWFICPALDLELRSTYFHLLCMRWEWGGSPKETWSDRVRRRGLGAGQSKPAGAITLDGQVNALIMKKESFLWTWQHSCLVWSMLSPLHQAGEGSSAWTSPAILTAWSWFRVDICWNYFSMCVWLPVLVAGIDGTFRVRKNVWANGGDRTHKKSVPNQHRIFFNTLFSCPEVKELFLKIKQNIIKAIQSNDLEQIMVLNVQIKF